MMTQATHQATRQPSEMSRRKRKGAGLSVEQEGDHSKRRQKEKASASAPASDATTAAERDPLTHPAEMKDPPGRTVSKAKTVKKASATADASLAPEVPRNLVEIWKPSC